VYPDPARLPQRSDAEGAAFSGDRDHPPKMLFSGENSSIDNCFQGQTHISPDDAGALRNTVADAVAKPRAGALFTA